MKAAKKSKKKSTKNSAKAKFLVIVESPGKIRALSRFLGSSYRVQASLGHVRDLPRSKFGVDIENNFEPGYITVRGKGKQVNRLKKEAKNARAVFLAPDPDREGEAIAWHLYHLLRSENETFHRITCGEITAAAVREAVKHPGRIDQDKVDAQQARRVMDRIMGYKLSPLLWEKVASGLSAGRVQSVALLLICEREEEIEAFSPEEFWTIDALLEKPQTGESFRARLEKIDSRKVKIPDEEHARMILEELSDQEFRVAKVERKNKLKSPPPPFITSSLQTEATRRFRWPVSKIMRVAQQLYEGIELGESGAVGLITYMRTDSYRVAPEAIEKTRKYIRDKLGEDYLPDKPRFFRARKGAQEAHEAIRPTDVAREPSAVNKFLSPDQNRLYDLIWKRALASQMAPAHIRSTTVSIQAGIYLFVAREEKVTFDGFMKIYGEKIGNQISPAPLPALDKDEIVRLLELKPEQHFTTPPARYTEGTLVKVLEKNGVGRPSTYAPTIGTLHRRRYVEKIERKLRPTELGKTVNTLLQRHFPRVINVQFTAGMEEELDEIEEGRLPWRKVVGDFYQPFISNLARAEKEMKNLKKMVVPTELSCEKCGKPMVIRWGRNGEFLACSDYPECRNTANFRRTEDGKVEIVPEEVTGITCEKCGKPMVVKTGRYGKFLACSGYPECRNKKPYPTGVPCPEEGCGGELVLRRSRKGRRFYGCSNYPKCKFVTRWLPKRKGSSEEKEVKTGE